MHSATAHHPPADGQPVPEQQQLPSQVFAQNDAIWYGISLWPVWVGCPSHIPSQLLVPPLPAYSQQLNHQCVINIFLIRNPKHSTSPATRRKFTIVAETRTRVIHYELLS